MGRQFAKPIRFHLSELHDQHEVRYNLARDLPIGAGQERRHGDAHLANWRRGVMKPLYYSGLARAGLIVRSDTLAPLRRFLESGRLFPGFTRKARSCAAKILLPKNYEWVQVESGLAQGVWLHLNLREEAAYWLGNYEARVQGVLEKLCRPGSIFYDIGANLGFFSFAVARCVGPNGKVIAFEPEQDNCLRFREMVLRNCLQGHVSLLEAAVWSYSSPAGLPFKRGRRPRAQGGVLADGMSPVLAEGEIVKVPALSLDDFLGSGHPVPDVLKIDVEGGECEVLKGAANLLCRKRPAVICEVHREQAVEWLLDWLPRKGYVASWSVPEELYPRLLVAQAAGAGQEERYFTFM
jgi:FkbM family methyltransferase